MHMGLVSPKLGLNMLKNMPFVCVYIPITYFDHEIGIRILILPHNSVSQTQGLLGTLDHEASNDFTPPQGRAVPAGSSEQAIYENFAFKCKLMNHLMCST